ncbi:MAG TPA: carboxypeptidase regulatory-like domain-containing protein [Patescibacteria group bacterium]|nr:carboxypeptidase regulatory-like domain-containing protein [Patescibacteria group bacterium]
MPERQDEAEPKKASPAEDPKESEAAASQDTPMPFDDPQTNQAVDDIVATESDELLAIQDAATETTTTVPRRSRAYRFWHSKALRYCVVLLILAGITATAVVQPARHWVLNYAGVRSSSSVTVIDEVTGQPLKNVQVQISAATARTNSEGKATVHDLRLGPTTLSVTRPGFARYDRQITIGWGSNPLGNIRLKAVGVQYTVRVQDFLTGNGIAGAEVSSGEATALSDKDGKAVLILPGTDAVDLPIQIVHDGYRTDTVVVKALTEQAVPVGLVTTHKVVYVNKQSGKYDVYSSDADGQNKKVILAGTGSENTNISLVVSPDGSRAALVSTRDNQKDADGFLLNTLTIITIATGDTVTIAHAEQIKLIDWVGSRLIFEQVSSDPTTPAASKCSIISYDYASTTRLQLAAANLFKSVVSAQNNIYYAVAASESDATAKPGFFKVSPDGTGKQTILDKEVWTVYRTDYNTFNLQTSDGWYTSNFTTGANSQIGAPTVYASRMFAENPAANGQSLWSDSRDNQGVLVFHDSRSGKDADLQRQNGLTNPIHWLTNESAVYRVVTGSETADYAVGTQIGAVPHKIADVFNTYGFSSGQ